MNWSGPDYKVRSLGPDTVTDDQKIYWSYDPQAMGGEKPKVEITASAVDAKDRVLASAVLRMAWDGDTAKVATP